MRANDIHLNCSKPTWGSVVKRKDMCPPSRTDISYTKKLFDGFDIQKDIPEFKTKNELYNWRDRIIRNMFD